MWLVTSCFDFVTPAPRLFWPVSRVSTSVFCAKPKLTKQKLIHWFRPEQTEYRFENNFNVPSFLCFLYFSRNTNTASVLALYRLLCACCDQLWRLQLSCEIKCFAFSIFWASCWWGTGAHETLAGIAISITEGQKKNGTQLLQTFRPPSVFLTWFSLSVVDARVNACSESLLWCCNSEFCFCFGCLSRFGL